MQDHHTRESVSLEIRSTGIYSEVHPHEVHEEEVHEDVPLVEFMYLVFTRMPGESYRRRLSSLLLYLCYVFRAPIKTQFFVAVLVLRISSAN